MADIEFSRAQKAVLVAKLKKYFDVEMGLELGQFDCEFLLDFLAEEFGAVYYNKGLQDAQVIVSNKMNDIADSIYEIEKPSPF